MKAGEWWRLPWAIILAPPEEATTFGAPVPVSIPYTRYVARVQILKICGSAVMVSHPEGDLEPIWVQLSALY